MVKSLNSLSWGPMSSVSSLFRRTERRACVPHAFWITCDAKNVFSAAARS